MKYHAVITIKATDEILAALNTFLYANDGEFVELRDIDEDIPLGSATTAQLLAELHKHNFNPSLEAERKRVKNHLWNELVKLNFTRLSENPKE